MAAKSPITVKLPADLPTTWQVEDVIAPDGADANKEESYGYNYLMEQVNAAQRALLEVSLYFPNLALASDLDGLIVLDVQATYNGAGSPAVIGG